MFFMLYELKGSKNRITKHITCSRGFLNYKHFFVHFCTQDAVYTCRFFFSKSDKHYYNVDRGQMSKGMKSDINTQ